MRSTFSRQFGLTAGMLLLSFILLGTSFTSLLYNHFVRQEKESLSTNATAVRSYIMAQGSLDVVTSWDNMLSVIGADLFKGFISPVAADCFCVCETPESVFRVIEKG